ncbi:hypothetical protein EXE41_01220 [Halorubrum sp. SD690R]|uniref:oligosaccharide flippase family protein n=1 Tax=Halorubrum sp. SD690R TaxID=2518117 RepID=UPI0010F45657|nr:oligosaccharide flippase family protein [Halorubrum sp. SD690R]TKX48527.1 hypothetical protein EXE41_01220 [Halorubrum sp. SD690R]
MGDNSSIVTIAREGGITLFGSIIDNLLRFAFLMIITRLITQTTYGQFTLATSIILFSYQVFDLNIANAINYFIPIHIKENRYGHAKSVLFKGITLGTTTTVLGSSLIVWSAPFLSDFFDEPRLKIALYLLSVTLPLLGIFRIFLAVFDSIKNLKYRVYTEKILRPAGKIIFTIILYFILEDLIALIGGFIISLVLTVIISAYFIRGSISEIIGSIGKSTSYKSLVTYSWPLIFSGMIYAGIGQIDLFAIGYFLPSADVGAYNVAFALASTLVIFLSSLRRIHKPIVAENRNDNSELEFFYRLITRWRLLLIIPPAITLIIAPDVYLSLFFTEEYAAAGSVVTILSIRLLLLAAIGPQIKTLEGIGYTQFVFINSALILILNTLLNILFIPMFGIVGAALGTLVASVIGSLVGICELYYYRGIQPITRTQMRISASMFLTSFVGYIVSSIISGLLLALLLPIIIITTNLACLRLTNSFTDKEREIAERIDSKVGYKIAQYLIR